MRWKKAVFKQTDLTLLQSTACYKNSNKFSKTTPRSLSLTDLTIQNDFILDLYLTTCQTTPAQRGRRGAGRGIGRPFNKVINAGSDLKASEDFPPFLPPFSPLESVTPREQKSGSRPHTQPAALPLRSAKAFPALLAFICRCTRLL